MNEKSKPLRRVKRQISTVRRTDSSDTVDSLAAKGATRLTSIYLPRQRWKRSQHLLTAYAIGTSHEPYWRSLTQSRAPNETLESLRLVKGNDLKRKEELKSIRQVEHK